VAEPGAEVDPGAGTRTAAMVIEVRIADFVRDVVILHNYPVTAGCVVGQAPDDARARRIERLAEPRCATQKIDPRMSGIRVRICAGSGKLAHSPTPSVSSTIS